MSAVGAYGEAEYIGFKLEYAAATAAAGSAIYSTTGAGGVTYSQIYYQFSMNVHKNLFFFTCPIAVCCCSLRFDRHVERKSRNCVLYRLVVRCGVTGAGNEFGEPLGGIIS